MIIQALTTGAEVQGMGLLGNTQSTYQPKSATLEVDTAPIKETSESFDSMEDEEELFTVPTTKEERDELIVSHQYIVEALARKYAKAGYRGCDYDELVGVGNLRLVQCAYSYSAEHKVKFSTYAYKSVTNEMMSFISQNFTILSTSHRQRRKANADLVEQKRHGEEATAFDDFIVSSTDSPDFIDVADEEDCFKDVVEIDFYESLVQNLQLILDPDEYDVFMLRTGLADGVEHTLIEIGKERGVDEANIRYYYNKALSKIRSNPKILINVGIDK